MTDKDRLFTLGVAYYPDYLSEGKEARLASGEIKRLTVAQRLRVDFERMRKDGIGVVRIGEFSWSHVEPSPGVLHTEVFTQTLDLALEFDISVMLCTPTATPPKWLIDAHPEILPITRSGYRIPWGGRRHYDPESPHYRAESRRITEVYAKAFGTHPAVTAWQTDNELANHSSAEIFTDAVLAAFRLWLERQFAGDIACLNETWFTCFWSQHYRSFNEVELPKHTWTEANPHLELAYRRFMSESYRDFQRDQVEIIRRYSPGRRVTHNIVPMMFDICLWQLCEDLDVAGYDHYQMQAVPDPLSSASQYNLMRSLKGGRKFIVLEQQPVQVNWQQVNGRWGIDWLFLWGMQAAFLGAEAMYYFSWQRFYGGVEQYHDGIVPHDLRLPKSRQELIIAAKTQAFAAVASHFDLRTLPCPTTDVLIIHNMESLWAHDISSQTTLWNGVRLIEQLQRPFLRRGLGIAMAPSIVAAKGELSQAKVLILPGYAFELSTTEIAAIEDFIAAGGSVWSLPRTAVKDQHGRMSPYPLQLFARDDFYFDDAGGLLAQERETIRLIQGGPDLQGQIWAEKIVIANHERWTAAAHFDGGPYDQAPAIIMTRPDPGHGIYAHFAFYPVMNEALEDYIMQLFGLKPRLFAAFDADVQTYSFSDDGRSFLAAVNFAATPQTLTLPNADTTHLVKSYRSSLHANLTLNEAAEGPSQSHSCLQLAPRSMGFWELSDA